MRRDSATFQLESASSRSRPPWCNNVMTAKTPKTPAKLKVAESDTSKRLAEPKGNLIPADHPKHGAWSAAVAGKDSEGNDGLIQKAGKFYRNDAAGNMNLVEV